jgi:hypothetical protein
VGCRVLVLIQRQIDAYPLTLNLVRRHYAADIGNGWALSTSPMFTANWDAPSDDRWTVPAGMGITRTFILNRQPMSLGINYYHNVVVPARQASNLLRFTWSLIFPTATTGARKGK